MVKRKKGTKRDKNAPKRPPTAFFLFCKERREHVREQTKKEDPKSGVVEVARKLGEIWRSLSEQDKDKYVKLAVIEKGKYDPSLPLAFKIAVLFGLPIEEVFSPNTD